MQGNKNNYTLKWYHHSFGIILATYNYLLLFLQDTGTWKAVHLQKHICCSGDHDVTGVLVIACNMQISSFQSAHEIKLGVLPEVHQTNVGQSR